MSSELLTVEQAFYTGDYNAVINADGSSGQRIRELQIRALAANGEVQKALSFTEGEAAPVFKALKSFLEKDVAAADSILGEASDDDATRHIVALTHASQGDLSKALNILQSSGQYLDASLLKIHILLALERNSEALSVVDETRKYANDHIIFNVGEALTALRSIQSAQKAYFIFEENNSVHPSSASSLGESVANIELGRFPEAAESMPKAVADESLPSLVSALSLALIQGDSDAANEYRTKLQLVKYAESPYVADLKSKEEAFGRILERFAA